MMPAPIFVAVGTVIVTALLAICFKFLKKGHPKTLTGSSETIPLKLIEKEELSHDTRRFRFALPSPNHILGLPVGKHISLRYKDNEGKLVARPYTPVTSDDHIGYVDLVIKVYFKDVHPKFPMGGKMSQHLNNMKIGETIDVTGPKGKLEYEGNGIISIRHRPRDEKCEKRHAKKIGMIAGGTGITPILQVVRQAIQHPQDTTEFSIIFANQTEEDILLREELDQMHQDPTVNVKVWYTVDRTENKDWKYSTGYINEEMIKEHLPAPADDVQILMCGPPPMLKFAALPALESLGFKDTMHFSF